MKQTEMMEKQDTEAYGSSAREETEEFAGEVSETSVAEAQEEVVPKQPIALRLLRQIELFGMKIDYGRMAKGRTGEEWYVGRAGVVQGPVTFREVLEYLVDGGGTVNVIHESAKESEDPQWTEFAYTPLWVQKWPARFWTLAFWVIVGIFGFCVVQAVAPQVIRRYVEIAYLLGIAGWIGYRFFQRVNAPKPSFEGEPESEA